MLQQQKKTDFNSIIGLVLIGLVLFWFTFNQSKLEDTQIEEAALLLRDMENLDIKTDKVDCCKKC